MTRGNVDNKYIVIEDEFGNEVPVLFPPSVKHIDIGHRQACVSAGFYRVIHGKAHAFGESETLKLKSREIDTLFIQRMVGTES